jgi:hypothetical protein
METLLDSNEEIKDFDKRKKIPVHHYGQVLFEALFK